jgi:hypothetical protein
VDTASALLACGLEAIDGLLAERRWMQQSGEGDEVLARLEDLADFVEVEGERCVDDAIRLEAEKGVEVPGRPHTDRGATQELPRVDAVLLRVVGVDSDQLEIRVVEDPAQRVLPDVSRGPLDHAIGHDASPVESHCGRGGRSGGPLSHGRR